MGGDDGLRSLFLDVHREFKHAILGLVYSRVCSGQDANEAVWWVWRSTWAKLPQFTPGKALEGFFLHWAGIAPAW
jgi:hypothetical protein